MYIVNQSLKCINSCPGLTCEFFNRVVEWCMGGEPQVKESVRGDENLVQLEGRVIETDVTLESGVRNRKEPVVHQEPLQKIVNSFIPKSSVYNDLTVPEDPQLREENNSEYYEGDPLKNREIEQLKARSKNQPAARRSRQFDSGKSRPGQLKEETSRVRQRINFVNLEEIRRARGDTGTLRMLLKGSIAECLRLFIKAGRDGDVITQIELALAFSLMRKHKDQNKDVIEFQPSGIMGCSYYSRQFEPCPFNTVWDIAYGKKDCFANKEGKGTQAIKRAAELGYLPAILEQKYQEWQGCTNSYGFASSLTPYVGKGFGCLDYQFGLALKNGSITGSSPYYAGMVWMEHSLGIKILYSANQPLESFIESDDRAKDLCKKDTGKYYLDGFLHLSDGGILALSEEAWTNFRGSFMSDKHVIPTSYLLCYEMDKIIDIMNKFQIEISEAKDVTESLPMDTNTIIVSEEGTEIGQISVCLKMNKLEICESMKDDEEIQILIDFIKDAMTRGVSAASVCSCIDKVKRAQYSEI